METNGMRKSQNELPKYFSIEEILNHNPANITLNEPIMVNYGDSFKPLLIGTDKDGRQWIFIGADGPPYYIDMTYH